MRYELRFLRLELAPRVFCSISKRISLGGLVSGKEPKLVITFRVQVGLTICLALEGSAPSKEGDAAAQSCEILQKAATVVVRGILRQ
jgi:hypothetical protein